MIRIAVAGVLVAVASIEVAPPAQAACNAIPGVEILATATAENRLLPQFGFKGALGRIDRVYLLRPAAKTMAIAPDGVCVSADAAHPATPAQLPPADDLVALLYVRSGDAKRSAVQIYAPPATCTSLSQAIRSLESEPKAAPLEVFKCSNDKLTVSVAPHRVTIPLPESREAADAFGSAGTSPAVRVVVGPKAQIDAAFARSAANRACRELCREFAQKGGVACIDEIFAVSTAATGQSTYLVDEVPCEVQMPIGIQDNDFSKACENEDTTPPACQPPASLPALKMWQDDCGGIHIPIDWSAIRGGAIRVVRGRSGIGRKGPADNPRGWVPGREFLGSTPSADPQGTLPGISWRKPLVDVWYEASNPEEYGMKGTADQDESIVHVFPTLRTDMVCAGTQGANACMGVEQSPDPGIGGYVACECLDRGDPGCTCERLVTARYFACGSGTKAGMPCTRDRHCNPDGLCNAKPHCQPDGAVWIPGQVDNSAKECTVVEDCRNVTGKKQCGYRLFNLDGAVESGGNGIIVVDSKIMGGPRHRRGVCKNNPQTACGNGGGSSPGACSSGDCRGYQLVAGPSSTTSSTTTSITATTATSSTVP